MCYVEKLFTERNGVNMMVLGSHIMSARRAAVHPLNFISLMNIADSMRALISDPRTWISTLGLVVSFLTFWRNRPVLQLKRDQQAQMAVVASRATVLWDQMQTIIATSSSDNQIDAYLFPSLKANGRRLEESIDKAIGLGLFTILVGDDSLSLTLFTAYVQSLSHTFSAEPAEAEAWTKRHLLMGMVRLLESCRRYEKDSKSRLGVPLPSFSPDVLEYSRSYDHTSPIAA
jgi:hypothetical protein